MAETNNDQGKPKKETTINREVVVITPFGISEDSEAGERKAILNVQRIKQIMENHVEVVGSFGAKDRNFMMKYNVSVAYSEVGVIPEESLEKIVEADILIAILTEVNVNVIFELAVRNLMKAETMLIVQGDPKKVLPIHLLSMAYISYDNERYQEVQEVIDSIASQPDLFPVSWGDLDSVPEQLATKIKKDDDAFKKALTKALYKLEVKPPQRPPSLRKFATSLSTKNILNSWTTFIPWSVVQIRWYKRSGRQQYLPGDMKGAPIVCQGNSYFLELFDLQKIENPDGKTPLTFGELMERVKGFMDEKHYNAFIEEQGKLNQTIIFERRNAIATVPIQFNEHHGKQPNMVFLPVLVGKRTVGGVNAPHSTFLLIAFIADFWPIGYRPDMLKE